MDALSGKITIRIDEKETVREKWQRKTNTNS